MVTAAPDRTTADADTLRALAELDAALARGLEPDADLTVSAWADRHRVLAPRASAEPGPWRTDRTPYLRAIMDALGAQSPATRVVVMAGAQVGKTEAGLNWLGYVMAHAPGPALAVQPTTDTARRLSRQRLDPMIDSSPTLRALVRDRSTKFSGNTQLAKEFPGGLVVLTGANSAAGLRSMPARYLFLDEVDAYPLDLDGEGDPLALAEARTRTFARRKILVTSTPTLRGLSRIEREYLRSDQRRYFVPCPACGAFQVLAFERLRWTTAADGTVGEVEHVCATCEAPMPERVKPDVLARGDWRPTATAEEPDVVGFHLSALYAPLGWSSWRDAVVLALRAKREPEVRATFANTVLGEPFEQESDAPDWTVLYARREAYPIGRAPHGVVFVTAGVDVQKDRLEVEVVGWGRRRVSWSLDYHVLRGDTANPDSPAWRALADVLATEVPHASGASLPIRVMAVDAGYATQAVYEWARRYPQAAWGPAGIAARAPRTVLAVKSQDAAVRIIGGASRERRGVGRRRWVQVFSVGSHLVKTELYAYLRQPALTEEAREAGEEEPHGFCHFPEYGEEFFRQLTAERLVTRQRHGFPVQRWEKVASQPNEALDCRVYARAAAFAFGLDRFSDRDWKTLDAHLAPPAPKPAPVKHAGDAAHEEVFTVPPRTPRRRGRPRRIIRSSWMA